MRILFLTQVLPFPLDAGPKVRAHYVLKYLSQAGHEVHLVSFVRNGESATWLPAVRRLCASVTAVPIVRSRVKDVFDGVRSVASGRPFLLVRDQQAAMWSALRMALDSRSFDALHADQLWMAPYGMNGMTGGLSTVLDQHNAVFMVPHRMAKRQRRSIARALLEHEAIKLNAFEREACSRFDRVVWVTREDRDALIPKGGQCGLKDVVIPIATDPSAQQPIRRERPCRIMFLGGMHWPPNHEGATWMLEQVWPAVASAVPSAVLTLIGRGGDRLVRHAPYAHRVEAPGYVADLGQYLARTAVFVVPLWSGAGMRVKILDAWCWGLPTVSTTIGAEGMLARDGENLLLADDAASFARAVIDVLEDVGLASRLTDAGRATVETHYDWTTVYRAWDRIYPV